MASSKSDATVTQAPALPIEDDEEGEDDDNFKPITEIPIPACFDIFFALTGITTLAYEIEKEKKRRSDDSFQNRFSEVEELVTSLSFEVAIGAVIILNCFLIGWEASVPEGEMKLLFNICEHFFTLFFFGEWCLRIVAFGWVWITDTANAADTVLVFGTGVLLKWVAEPAGMDVGNFRILTVLRAVRLVRLARAVRLVPKFKEMWILVQGLRQAARPLLWTVVIAFSVLYVFAIAATEFIGKGDDFKDHPDADRLFGNFLRSMFTMLQLITVDTACDQVIRPMMKVQPWLAFFFVFFITVGVFIVMNLVTAIIVDNAFSIISEDKDTVAKDMEQEKRKELKDLANLFFELDLDGSGELSREEFFGSLENKKVVEMLDMLEMKKVDLADTWEVLDDGDGQLTIKEFTDGIRRMKGEAKAKDIADVVKKLHATDRKHSELKKQAEHYSRTLQELDRDADEMARHTQEVVSLFKEMYHRLAAHIAQGEKDDRARAKQQEMLARAAADMEESDREAEETEDEEEEVEPPGVI
jgi:hypothetical protein